MGGWWGKAGVPPRAESRDCLPQEFIKAEPPNSLRSPIRKKAMLACTFLVYPFLLAGARLRVGVAVRSASGERRCGLGGWPLTCGSAPWSLRWTSRSERT